MSSPFDLFSDERYKDYSPEEIADYVKKSNPDTFADYDVEDIVTVGRQVRNDADWQQGMFSDFIYSAQQGAVSMIRGDLETINLITDDEYTRAAADKLKAWEQENTAGMSSMAREAMAKEFITDDEDGGWSFGDAWSDPRAYLNIIGSGFGSLVGMFATGGPLKKGATKLLEKGFKHTAEELLDKGVAKTKAEAVEMAAKRLKKIEAAGAAAGYGTAEGAAVGGLTAADVGDSYDQMTNQMKSEAPMFRSLYHENKAEFPELTHEELFKKTDEELRTSLREEGALLAGVPSALLGAVFGPYMEKLIFGKAASTSRSRAFGKGVVAEGIPESLQGGSEQLAQNLTLSQIDPSIDPMSGVANSMVMEGIGGASAGGMTSAALANIQSADNVDDVVNAAANAAGSVTVEAANQYRHQPFVGPMLEGQTRPDFVGPTLDVTQQQINDLAATPEVQETVSNLTEETTLDRKSAEMDAAFQERESKTSTPEARTIAEAEQQIKEGGVQARKHGTLAERVKDRQLSKQLKERLKNEKNAPPEEQERRQKALEQWDDDQTIDENLKNVPINPQMARALASEGLITKQQAEEANIRFSAGQAATSPDNDISEPTDAQKSAGNYKMGKTRVHGMDISIENPQGSTRSGTNAAGDKWSQTMTHHYGYIRGTKDKYNEPVDVFLGPRASDPEGTVFVVDQVNPGTTQFDEHKVMMGFENEQQAVDAYLSNYEDGWTGLGSITPMSVEQFKSWVKNPANTSRRLSLRKFKGQASYTLQEMRKKVEKQESTETKTAQETSVKEGVKLHPGDIEHKREKKSGRYVGAPEWVGNSPDELESLRSKLKTLAKEGEAGKHWYENSSKAILDFVGGNKDEAEKLVGLIALYSPNATVPANTTMALTAYYQWKAGVPINAGFGEADQKAMELLIENKPWSGIKTNSFYQNLMVEINPAKLDKHVATMDMWMAIAFDYGMKTLDQGPKYKFTNDMITNIAKELGWKAHQVQAAIWTAMKGRVDPIRGKLLEQELEQGIKEIVTRRGEKVAEFVKTPDPTKNGRLTIRENQRKHFHLAHKLGMEYELSTADIDASKYDFSDALHQRAVQMSWEATPSKTAGDLPGIHKATTRQLFSYLRAITKALTGRNGQDLIAELIGLHTPPRLFGYSAWKGLVGAGAQDFIAVPAGTADAQPGLQQRDNLPKNAKLVKAEARDLLDQYAALRGLILHQDAVVWHQPVYDDAKIRLNGVDIAMARPGTKKETQQLYDAIYEEFGTWDLAPGYTQSGYRVLNFNQESGISNQDFQKRMESVINSLPKSFGGGHVRIRGYRSDGEYVGNNWETAANGRFYKRRLPKGSSDLLWKARGLRARVEAVNKRFAKKYGWGNPEGDVKFAIAPEERLSDGRVSGSEGRLTPAAKDAATLFNRPEGDFVEVPPGDTKLGKFIVEFVNKILGKKVVILRTVKGNPLRPNGFISDNDPNTIYLNENSTRPHMAILGHELLHAMKSDHPDLYTDLMIALRPMLMDYAPYRQWLSDGYAREGAPSPSEELIIEELIADLMGDSFLDSAFWNNVKVQQPALFERILTAVKTYLDGVVEFLIGRQMQGTEYFRDYKAARDVASQALSDYIKTKQSTSIVGMQIEEEVVVEETGDSVVVRENAAVLLRQSNDRMKVLMEMRRCIAA